MSTILKVLSKISRFLAILVSSAQIKKQKKEESGKLNFRIK